MDQDLNATPVSRLVCSSCGHEMDVAGRAAFSQVKCEQCGTQLTIPVMLGQFLLVERMGTGGMGSVYRALDTALNRFVAIKVMRSALGEDDKLVQSFISEAQAAAALNHPNIVQIYSCGTEKGQPYIVMELVTGGQMNHMFSRDEPMKESKLLKYAMDIAEGLKAANEVGLVHGDIKPENVLVDQNGTAKIVDFGLAQFVNAQKDRGEIWGTPYYISPERARGNKADHRSDIYSLGASMFHALAGQPPFDGKTAADVVLERLKHPPPDLHELRPDLQTETVELVKRMMAADPYLRYPNSASLKSDMKDALAAAREAGRAERHKHAKKSNTSSVVVATVSVLAAIGLGYGFVRWLQSEENRLPAPVEPDTPTAIAPAEPEPEAEDEDLFTVEEVKGPDGKVRLRMNIRFFEEDEVEKLVAAAEAVSRNEFGGAGKELDALKKRVPAKSVRAMWIPVLDSVSLWASGNSKGAERGLQKVASVKVDRKDDHPAHMPRVIAGYLLGELNEDQLKNYRKEWPAWFGDLVHLLEGVKELQAGNNDAGWRNLKAYLDRNRTEPAWVYAYRPAVAAWSESYQDWEDIRRRVERQLGQGITGPARRTLTRYEGEVPPMLSGELGELMETLKKVEDEDRGRAELERERRQRRAVQRDLDLIDAKMSELSPMLVRDRDYRKASLSLSRLPSAMKTDQGREAAEYVRELVERLDGLKRFIIDGADVLTYSRRNGSDLGGDVIGANTLGIKVSLDGRAVSTRGWEAIPLRSFVRMADFYVGSPRISDDDRAEALLSLGVFSLVNGAFDPAQKYAARAVELKPDLEESARRLLPGLAR